VNRVDISVFKYSD